MLKSQKGITLVALVITIIVLVILAGVTISLVMGDGGIITRAEEGSQSYLNAEAQEQEYILNAEHYINEALSDDEAGDVTDLNATAE